MLQVWSIKVGITGNFYTYGLFGISGKKVDELIQDLGIGTTITTALIENPNSFIRDNVQYMRGEEVKD